MSLSGTGGASLAWGAYGDIPFSIDADSNGDGDIAVYRPSTGMWWGHSPAYSIPWGQPGDLPMPSSSTGALYPELTVYRPSHQWVYHCEFPTAGGCISMNNSGPLGSPGIVPIAGGTK